MVRERRRLAAIVSADVVGYSRLMARDELGTLAAFKSHRCELFDPKIEEHGGRIVKTTGDGLLLEFSSVVDAVRCAFEVQRGMAARNKKLTPEQRMEFRIGINVGDVILDEDDIFGDGVNVAARLQTLADPGGICVSGAVRDQVVDKVSFAFQPLGAQLVKNIPRPIEVYRLDLEAVRATAPVPSRRRRSWSIRSITLGTVALLATAGLLLAMFKLLPPDAHVVSTPPAMSVAVFPVAAAPEDSRLSTLAESITRNVATSLSREGGWANYPRVRVMLVSDDGSSRPGGDIGSDRRPNVRYFLQADVNRSDAGYVTNFRLIDAATRTQVWSKRGTWREVDVSSNGSLQLRKVSEEIRGAIQGAETRRVMARPRSELSPMELVLRAIELSRRDQTLEGTIDARSLVDEALRRQPDLVPALLSRSWLADRELDVDPDPSHRERILSEYDEFTKRAIDLDATDPVAWDFRSTALMYRGRWDAALEANATSIGLSPDKADFYASRVWLMNMSGKPAEALTFVDKALALEPDLINLGYVLRVACEAYLLSGQPEKAIANCEKAAGIAKDDLTLALFLAAAYANAGDQERAAAGRTDVLRIVPGFTIDQLRAKRYSDHPDYKRLAEKYWYAGLRSAGLAEH